MNSVASIKIDRLSLQVADIRCANCALKIEKSLTALDGVFRCRTNVADKRVVIELDPTLLSESAVVAALNAIGFGAIVDEDRQAVIQRLQTDGNLMLARLGVAGIGMMQVMMFALATYVAGEGGIEAAYVSLMKFAGFAIATPVVFYSAMPFHIGALLDLKHRRLGMDVPVSLAISAAYGLSSWHLFTDGEVYFDSVCMFTFLLLIGRYLELRSRHQYEQSVSIAERCLPESAFVPALSAEMPIKQITTGMSVRVLPGETVPVDGVVSEGNSAVSEAAFSGESAAIRKQPGMRVLAGSMNLDGEIIVCCSSVVEDFVISKLSELHQEAMLYKPPFARLADIVAGYFVSGVLLLALSAGVYWYLAGNPDWFVILITVLVVSCPCALSLATPVVYTVAVTALKRLGVVVSAGKFLEQLSSIDHIVFDKTGTLTEGSLEISEVTVLAAGWTKAGVLDCCSALESDSRHPIARAFDAVVKQPARNTEQVVGEGVLGSIDGHDYRLGKADFAGFPDLSPPQNQIQGTWVLLGGSEPIAWIRLNDDIRDSSAKLIQVLKPHYKITLLSGDRSIEVDRVAKALSINDAKGDLSPADKVAYVRKFQAAGDRVLMVGDGMNDAAAMGIANTAVAVSPVDILVQDAADATLLRQDIFRLWLLIGYSKRIRNVLRQNISWAVLYNLSVIPFAVAGWLEPWMAALGMSMSSLLVIVNANRLNSVEVD
ncbi:MAG: Cu2+-exporting ATPase [Candidatus Azotimanducaceae bacterium]|jgi:Cu2+-exporting ATPase